MHVNLLPFPAACQPHDSGFDSRFDSRLDSGFTDPESVPGSTETSGAIQKICKKKTLFPSGSV